MKLFLLRYGELALKGKNRKAFEDLLIRNIRDALQGISAEVRRTYGRLFVHLHEENREREVLERLGRIFGLVSISPVDSAPLNMEDIQARALATIQKGAAAPFTFKVETRRSNKAFPLESPEISRITGAHILSNVAGSKVDVHHPDIILHMEIREKEAYVYHLSYPGCGGLPVGASGRALLLLSGGIDSPVAGWMGMKRGLEIEALHFHSFPFTSERAKDKVLQIASMMARYSGKLILHVAGFTGIQEAIHKECPPAMRITIMRRMMFRVAERLAASRGAGALVTGESLGQVASQTLESIAVTDVLAERPVFRPLIGMDKQEIIDLARKIGTYEISILPYEDCCTVFVPKHPATRPKLLYTEKVESFLDVNSLLDNCLENIESVTLPT
ncbi:MAG: tRNA 4-thiouridine(8) synthase ThiI [Firmicutes bacterium]|jgi:thiamine biosynthesis protein ThiI|nr:tRNA 4-thiouridine(8) synthase ThiI [Bacillota bacterium]